jgi:hypothetical protein
VKEKSAASYIENISDAALRRLARKVRAVIQEAIPEADESLKMGMPCYSIGNKIVASIGDYTHHINLYFAQGAILCSDLLEGSGKGMRHVRIQVESDIIPDEFSKLLKQAVKNAQKET